MAHLSLRPKKMKPRWSIWKTKKVIPAVPSYAPGRTPVFKPPSPRWRMPIGTFMPKYMQNFRSRMSSFLGEVNKTKKKIEYIHQGAITKSPSPRLLSASPWFKKQRLIFASPKLKVRSFAKRYKGLTHQIVDILPSKEIPEGYRMRSEPKFVKDIEVIAFADVPVGRFKKGGRSARRRNKHGFLRSILS